jgi:hypothetical protein
MVRKIMSDLDYAIALQRAIEYHCSRIIIPEWIIKDCPHHAEMLNKLLVKQKKQVDAVPCDEQEPDNCTCRSCIDRRFREDERT